MSGSVSLTLSVSLPLSPSLSASVDAVLSRFFLALPIALLLSRTFSVSLIVSFCVALSFFCHSVCFPLIISPSRSPPLTSISCMYMYLFILLSISCLPSLFAFYKLSFNSSCPSLLSFVSRTHWHPLINSRISVEEVSDGSSPMRRTSDPLLSSTPIIIGCQAWRRQRDALRHVCSGLIIILVQIKNAITTSLQWMDGLN